jgi:hypothetical protein
MVGEKAENNSSLVLSCKYEVAALLGPVNMFLASFIVICEMALAKIGAASLDACSAARFKVSSNSSTLLPMPKLRNLSATCETSGGKGIRISEFLLKPSNEASFEEAFLAPIVKASFNPLEMSASVNVLPDKALAAFLDIDEIFDVGTNDFVPPFFLLVWAKQTEATLKTNTNKRYFMI